MGKIYTPEFWKEFWQSATKDSLHSLTQIAGIIVAYLVLRYLLFRLIDGILAGILARENRLGTSAERTGRLETLRGLTRSLVGYVLFFVFGVLLLQAIGFNIMPFITTAGVIGLAVGFGAQKLVKDVISGFFIIIDNLFVVGDTVTIGAVTGRVEEMGMRVTRIHEASGKIHILSNGDIGIVTNLSRNPVEDFIEVNVDAAADLSRVVAVIKSAGEALHQQPDRALKAAPHVVGITAFSAASVTVRVAVVADPKHLIAEQMRVREAVRTALLTAEIPLA